jgi:hypothetical protein
MRKFRKLIPPLGHGRPPHFRDTFRQTDTVPEQWVCPAQFFLMLQADKFGANHVGLHHAPLGVKHNP